MLDVELQLVVAAGRQHLDEACEGLAGRDPVPADVEHEPPGGEVGVVGEAHRGQGPVGVAELLHRLSAVAEPGVVRVAQLRALIPDGEGEPLGRQRRVRELHQRQDVTVRRIEPVDPSGPGEQERFW